MDRPYATPEGVRAYLSSLKGLHALREDRRSASARREWLPAFCVLGNYVLTADGRFGELSGPAPKDLPDVVTLDELEQRSRRFHGKGWSLAYRTPAALAPYDGLCPECGRGWTFQQRADMVEVDDARTVLVTEHAGWILTDRIECAVSMHVACHEAMRARDALLWSDDILIRTGFGGAAQEPCAPSEGGHGRWFRFATPIGTIRFGPRRSGFGIDWSDTGKDLMGRFCRVEGPSPFGPLWNEPPVPHGPHFVDPKDEAWLIRYLDRLRRALGL